MPVNPSCIPTLIKTVHEVGEETRSATWRKIEIQFLVPPTQLYKVCIGRKPALGPRALSQMSIGTAKLDAG